MLDSPSRGVIQDHRGAKGWLCFQPAQPVAHQRFDDQVQPGLPIPHDRMSGGEHARTQQGGLQDAVFVQHHDAAFKIRPVGQGAEIEAHRLAGAAHGQLQALHLRLRGMEWGVENHLQAMGCGCLGQLIIREEVAGRRAKPLRVRRADMDIQYIGMIRQQRSASRQVCRASDRLGDLGLDVARPVRRRPVRRHGARSVRADFGDILLEQGEQGGAVIRPGGFAAVDNAQELTSLGDHQHPMRALICQVFGGFGAYFRLLDHRYQRDARLDQAAERDDRKTETLPIPPAGSAWRNCTAAKRPSPKSTTRCHQLSPPASCSSCSASPTGRSAGMTDAAIDRLVKQIHIDRHDQALPYGFMLRRIWSAAVIKASRAGR